MPLPTDERIVALANDLLEQFDLIFGMHPGYRAVQADSTGAIPRQVHTLLHPNSGLEQNLKEDPMIFLRERVEELLT